MKWLVDFRAWRRWLSDLREGGRILLSRQFWRDFNDFWSEDRIRERTDEWIHTFRENTGLPPDPEVELRRRERKRRIQVERRP